MLLATGGQPLLLGPSEGHSWDLFLIFESWAHVGISNSNLKWVFCVSFLSLLLVLYFLPVLHKSIYPCPSYFSCGPFQIWSQRPFLFFMVQRTLIFLIVKILFFGHKACGILVPWSRIKSAPPAVEVWNLNTGPPEKSLEIFNMHKGIPPHQGEHPHPLSAGVHLCLAPVLNKNKQTISLHAPPTPWFKKNKKNNNKKPSCIKLESTGASLEAWSSD